MTPFKENTIGAEEWQERPGRKGRQTGQERNTAAKYKARGKADKKQNEFKSNAMQKRA